MRLSFFLFLFLELVKIYCATQSEICYPVSTNTIAEIIDQCQNKEVFSGRSNGCFKWKGMSQEDFQSIFSFMRIFVADCEIVASTAKQMIFPKLLYYTIYGGSFLDYNLRFQLETSNWEKEYIRNQRISEPSSYHHNDHLEVLGFPELVTFNTHHGSMSFSHNPKLQKLSFPKLNSINFPKGSLIVTNNSALQSINMPAVQAVAITDLTITHNPTLQIIELDGTRKSPIWYSDPKLIEIHGKLTISENERLERVNFKGKLEEQPVTVHGMEIRNNKRLESVPFIFNNSNIEMRIEGNPKMERKVLEELRKAANLSWGRVQDYGECIMEEEIAELAILDDCRYIYGNLRLAAGARGTASCRLTRVEGNVYTGDVTVDRLDFLLEAEIYGIFESDLCDFDYSRFWAAKKGIWKSCTEKETTETTTESTRRTETMGITTVTETIGTTERREETTETTVTTEETEIVTMGRTEESTTTEEASTEESTQFTPMTDNLTESSSTQIVSPKKRETIPIRILIICGAVVLIVLFVGSAALFYYRKSKKKEERKMVEVSPNGSSSSKDSSSSRPSQTPASKSLGQ